MYDFVWMLFIYVIWKWNIYVMCVKYLIIKCMFNYNCLKYKSKNFYLILIFNWIDIF